MTIKTVLIDIDNTLLDFNESAKKSMQDAFIFYGLPLPQNLFATFKRINDGLWLKIEKGEITRADLHKVRWNMIFKELGIDFDGEVLEKRFLDNLYNTAVLVDGAKEILQYLSKKYPVYTASNAFYNQQINRLNISGLAPYITQSFVSEKIGFSKPSAEFFDACFRVIPYRKEQTIMIGDSISADIEGGKQYGLITCYFDREKTGEKVNSADFIVQELNEIKDIL